MRDPREERANDSTVEEAANNLEAESYRVNRRLVSRNTYIPPKPCSRGFKKFFRNYAKEFYKRRKAEERSIGYKINQLMQEFYYEKSHFNKDNSEESKKYLNGIVKELYELRQTPRFVREFPSFATFFHYIKKEGLSYNDLKELEDGRDS